MLKNQFGNIGHKRLKIDFPHRTGVIIVAMGFRTSNTITWIIYILGSAALLGI